MRLKLVAIADGKLGRRRRLIATIGAVEFRRISNLPPYVFKLIDELKVDARRRGVDIIDLGFGNPDIPSPEIAVEKLAEAARLPRNHRYSLSRGIPQMREAVAALYARRFGVELDPETEITNAIGSKEGFTHLMWTLLQPGDAAIVPSPSYPIHIYGPLFAGADLRQVAMSPGVDTLERLHQAWDIGWPKPRVLVISFPHNPTGACVDVEFMQRIVDFCREREMIAVHDFAYADIGFDGYMPPSILQAEGAKECAVELYSMTKGFSMAGWRIAFLVGNHEVVQALVKLKSYLDYGTFQPIQIAATVTMNEDPDLSRAGARDLRVAPQRALRRARAHRLGRPAPARIDVRVGADPRAVRRARLARVRVVADPRLRGRRLARATASAPAARASSASR